MAIFESLDTAEKARQLANPEGDIGLGVAEWMNANNREGTTEILSLLDVRPGNRVLEIGYGNGRAASRVIEMAPKVRYEGIDISPTMAKEARRFNIKWRARGLADFHLARADQMPFPDEAFDRVFAIGVIHFWQDALPSLREVCRVMRPGAVAVMGTLDPRSAPDFAHQEFGFYTRSASEWEKLCRQLPFAEARAESVETEQRTPDGQPIQRFAILVRLTR